MVLQNNKEICIANRHANGIMYNEINLDSKKIEGKRLLCVKRKRLVFL